MSSANAVNSMLMVTLVLTLFIFLDNKCKFFKKEDKMLYLYLTEHCIIVKC